MTERKHALHTHMGFIIGSDRCSIIYCSMEGRIKLTLICGARFQSQLALITGLTRPLIACGFGVLAGLFIEVN